MSYAYFQDRDDLKAAGVPVAADVELTALQPFLDVAESSQVLPALGRETLDQVQQENGESRALRLLRAVVAGYAAAAFAAANSRTVTSTGSEALPGTKEGANTDKLIRQHVAALELNAGQQLEALLSCLEADPDKYATWHQSKYVTCYPGRYFQTVEQLAEYPGTSDSRREFRRNQGALGLLVTAKVLPIIGRTLHQRLVQELNDPQHELVLGFIRQALACYLVSTDTHPAECALTELRWQLQREVATYPEFEDSPCFVETEILPTTTANCYVAIL